jgi:hypothetical protein
MLKQRRLAVLLLVLTALCGVAAAMYWPTPRRQALARLQSLDGYYIEEDVDEGNGPRRVVSISLVQRDVTDEDLPSLRDIRPLHRLLLNGCPITDAGLAHLADFEDLEMVNLTKTHVSDAGLAYLGRLPNLQILILRGTKVTDAGLAHLRGLKRLEVLNVTGTQVTNRALRQLRDASPALKFTHLNTEDDD